MSSEDLKLATFAPEAVEEAIALGNPPDAFRWRPVGEGPNPLFGSHVNEMWDGPMDELPVAGTMSFRVDADPRVFDSGAEIAISYERNTELLECAENLALDGTGGGLSLYTVESILDRVPKKSGWRTDVELRTLADGSLDIQHEIVPFLAGEALLNPVPLPAVALSSLQATHSLGIYPHIFLVQTMLDSPLDIAVFKAVASSATVEHVEFMARLPDIDFLLRPTHIVVDANHRLRGLLIPHHPASSLSLKMQSLHPDVGNLLLPPSGGDQSSCSLAETLMLVTWLVKLAWATDIAASVAWLHMQSIFWGDLKMENIVLCVDGHCRLIDYVPDGMTITWSPPEALQDQLAEQPTPAGDVFALGLVLWAVAMEVGVFERQKEFIRPQLMWNEETPHWFQSLVLSCLKDDPTCRPSARCVYDALLTCTWDE
ncbi:kinase-like domain-containing protein [Mycena amicta]|nr:kinase-like domain-containing protein [Mycena amicta]